MDAIKLNYLFNQLETTNNSISLQQIDRRGDFERMREIGRTIACLATKTQFGFSSCGTFRERRGPLSIRNHRRNVDNITKTIGGHCWILGPCNEGITRHLSVEMQRFNSSWELVQATTNLPWVNSPQNSNKCYSHHRLLSPISTTAISPGSRHFYPHTTFLHYSQEVQNLHETPVTQTQFESRALLKAFAVAAASAQSKYGVRINVAFRVGDWFIHSIRTYLGWRKAAARTNHGAKCPSKRKNFLLWRLPIEHTRSGRHWWLEERLVQCSREGIVQKLWIWGGSATSRRVQSRCVAPLTCILQKPMKMHFSSV